MDSPTTSSAFRPTYLSHNHMQAQQGRIGNLTPGHRPEDFVTEPMSTSPMHTSPAGSPSTPGTGNFLPSFLTGIDHHSSHHGGSFLSSAGKRSPSVGVNRNNATAGVGVGPSSPLSGFSSPAARRWGDGDTPRSVLGGRGKNHTIGASDTTVSEGSKHKGGPPVLGFGKLYIGENWGFSKL